MDSLPARNAPSPRRGVIVRLCAVVAVVFLLYGRTVGFGFSYLDDDILILEDQSFLAEPSSPLRAFQRSYFPGSTRDHDYYRPLVTASFALDARLGGVSPSGYHLTNVVLHAVACALLFVLLRRLGYRDDAATFGALVFAVHPALTETVAWIPGRPDALLTVFALAAWVSFERAGEGGRWGSRIVHGCAWLAALFCKELALVLPLVLLAKAWLVDRRPWRAWVAPWPLGVWMTVLGVYFAARLSVVAERAGAAGVSAASFFANVDVVLSSLGKLVLPLELSVLATREGSLVWPGVVVVALLLGLAFEVTALRRRVLFALCGFVVLIAPSLPASGVLTLESRLYLPAVMVALLSAELAARVRLPSTAKVSVAAALLGVLAAVAFVYSGNFRDRMTFSHAAARGSPQLALAQRNLGVALQLAGDADAALVAYRAALAADPTEPVVHNNLGVIYLRRGQLVAAEQNLLRELAVNPGYVPAHDNLALVLRRLGREREAEAHRQQAAELAARGR